VKSAAWIVESFEPHFVLTRQFLRLSWSARPASYFSFLIAAATFGVSLQDGLHVSHVYIGSEAFDLGATFRLLFAMELLK
jgi:hypothetical protein